VCKTDCVPGVRCACDGQVAQTLTLRYRQVWATRSFVLVQRDSFRSTDAAKDVVARFGRID
jgi:hypothetical protein